MPHGLRVILGYRCNMHCEFCYQVEHTTGFAPYKEFKGFMRALPHPWSPQYVTVMGGEPTLDPELVGKLQRLRAFYPGATLNLTTNMWASPTYYREILQSIDRLRLTVSLSARPVRQKFLFLHREFPHRVQRVNAMLCDLDTAYPYAKANRLQLTLCADQRYTDNVDYAGLQAQGFTISHKDAHTALLTDADGYEVWLFHHGDDYFGDDNLIMLPNGSLVTDYRYVLNCDGAWVPKEAKPRSCQVDMARRIRSLRRRIHRYETEIIPSYSRKLKEVRKAHEPLLCRFCCRP